MPLVMGWESTTGSALLFFYCQHLQIIQSLANTNLEIVELLAHRKPESVVLTVGRVV